MTKLKNTLPRVWCLGQADWFVKSRVTKMSFTSLGDGTGHEHALTPAIVLLNFIIPPEKGAVNDASEMTYVCCIP